jgi:hypothetical protein
MTVYYKIEAFVPTEHYDALLDWLTDRGVKMRMSFPFTQESSGFVPVFAASEGNPTTPPKVLDK